MWTYYLCDKDESQLANLLLCDNDGASWPVSFIIVIVLFVWQTWESVDQCIIVILDQWRGC